MGVLSWLGITRKQSEPAPRERGTIVVDHARPASDWLATCTPRQLDDARELLRGVMTDVAGALPVPPSVLGEMAAARLDARHFGECRQWADAIGVPVTDVVLANISYDLSIATIGCSTIALATPDGPVVARNLDWWPADRLARASVAVRHQRDGQPLFVDAGWPGGVGVVTGQSARGFCVVLNAVAGYDAPDMDGYPVLFHLRRVLEDASGFDAALGMLTSAHLTVPCLVTLVGRANDERVVVERTPTRHALRRPDGDAALVTTNHWVAMTPPSGAGPGNPVAAALQDTACERFDWLTSELGAWASTRRPDDGWLLRLLGATELDMGITAQHVLMRPRDGVFRVFTPARFE